MPRFFRIGLPILVVTAAIVPPIIVGWLVGESGDTQLYENQIAACERSNPLRGVVFRNTKISVQQSKGIDDPSHITQVFRDNFDALLATPGIDPRTGEVDCEAVIEKP